jgi:hypothetical protein
MLLAVLSVCSWEELADEYSSDEEAERAIVSEETSPEDASARRQQFKNKILGIVQMLLIFRRLRYAPAPPE